MPMIIRYYCDVCTVERDEKKDKRRWYTFGGVVCPRHRTAVVELQNGSVVRVLSQQEMIEEAREILRQEGYKVISPEDPEHIRYDI